MSTLGLAKRYANAVLSNAGQTVAHADLVPSFDRLVGHLRAASLVPRTVIDVGVASGTPWLYEAFPKAKYLLFDPTPQSLPHMEAWAKRLNADVFNVGLGCEDGALTLRIRADHSGSSLFEESVPQADIRDTANVTIRRFDAIAPAFRRPALMKIDTQGAELMILQGMGSRLFEIDCFIIETSPLQTLKDGPDFADVFLLLHQAGYAFFDYIGLHRRPADGALACMDAVFVPRNSAMRQNLRWD